MTMLALALLSHASLTAQTETLLLEWEFTFSPVPGAVARSLAEAHDGGWVVAGNIEQSPFLQEHRLFLLKVSSSGALLWDRQYVATVGQHGESVGVAHDGACAVAGFERVVTAEVDAFLPLLFGTDVDGNATWRAKILEDGYEGYLSDLSLDESGWLVVGASAPAGAEDWQLFIAKTDALGSVLWQKNPGTLQVSRGSALEAVEGGYVIAGAALEPKGSNLLAYLLKITCQGELVWERTYKWQNSFYNEAFEVLPTATGYFVVGGTIPFFDSSAGTYIIITDEQGVLASQSTLPSANDPTVKGFARGHRGGFVLGSGGSSTFRIRSLTDAGDVTSQYDVGSQQAFAVALGMDGGYVVVGKSYQGARIVKIAPERDFLRGDSNSDGTVNISDAVHVLAWLFLGGEEPLCGDAVDMNDDTFVNIADPIRVLNFLFLGDAQPPAPFLAPGADATPELLGCRQSSAQIP
jgi:hypothetical protein